MAFRKEKMEEQLRQLAAAFLQNESGAESLITITSVRVSHDLRDATLLLTVLPEKREQEMLAFAERRVVPLKEYIAARMRLRRIPFLRFVIDGGERNRQKIDAILRNS
jgi:ribosome-binding factor A